MATMSNRSIRTIAVRKNSGDGLTAAITANAHWAPAG